MFSCSPDFLIPSSSIRVFVVTFVNGNFSSPSPFSIALTYCTISRNTSRQITNSWRFTKLPYISA